MIIKEIDLLEKFVNKMNSLLTEKLIFKPFEFGCELSSKDLITLILIDSIGAQLTSDGFDSIINQFELNLYLNARNLKEIYEKLESTLKSFYTTLNEFSKVKNIELVSTNNDGIKQVNSHYQIKYSFIFKLESCL